MKSIDIFHLAIRLLGLFFIYRAVEMAPAIYVGLPNRLAFGSILAISTYIAVGWWLVGGAPLLMQRAYPESWIKGRDVAGGVDPK